MSDDTADLFATQINRALDHFWHEAGPLIANRPFPASSLVFHYTNAEAAINIIERQQLWLSNIAFLNDVNELTCARNVLSHLPRLCPEIQSDPIACNMIEELVKAWLAQAHFASFVSSFCEDGDLLGQWRGYGNGVSIAFDAPQLDEFFTGASLLRTLYREDEQVAVLKPLIIAATKYLIANAGTDHFAAARSQMLLELEFYLSKFSCKMKDYNFREEKEWRLVYERPKNLPFNEQPEIKIRMRGRSAVPYIELGNKTKKLPIRGVLVAPSADHSLLAAFHVLLSKHGYKDFFVERSRIPFRD